MFLVLEELGIAHMQDVWIRANAPEHEDAVAIRAQAEEFLADLKTLLSGKGEPSRIVANGWAGEALEAHLRAALGSSIPGEDVIGEALACYLKGLEKLTEADAKAKAAGGKLDPRLYIAFMAGWSGLFCGKKTALEIPEAFRP